MKKKGSSQKIKELSLGLLFGFSGYFLSILIMSRFSVINGWISLAALWIAAIISYFIFKRMKEIKADKPVRIYARDLIFRGVFGGCVVTAVVFLGNSTGYIWGGLFSSFPGTITPVLILLHLKNGKDINIGVIKSAPIGLSGTALYSCMVWLSYPAYGIIAGTLISYLAVLVFLSLIFMFGHVK